MTHDLNKDPLQETEGDTFSKKIRFADEEGDGIDITGWTIYVTVKESLEDPDSEAVLSQDVTSHDNPAGGETSFEFTPAQTADLDAIYYFEVKFEDTAGEVNTLLRRTLEFNKSVRETL